MQKPRIIAPNFSTIPAQLKDRPQWVVWKLEHRSGQAKPTKVPYDAKTKNRAATTDETSWNSFSTAVDQCQEGEFDGIGFVFSAEDDFAGIDLDNCLDPSGALTTEAATILKQFDTYAEVSPSGTGIKLILRGKLPGRGRRKGNIEIYDRSRYFTVTGARLPECSDRVNNCQAALEQLLDELFPEPAASQRQPSPSLGIDEIIAKAKAAKNGQRFSQLFDAGDYESAGYKSQSEADLALCNQIAFFAGPNPDLVDAVFRQSKLYREKWDREDYRTATIEKAIASCTEFYSGKGHSLDDRNEGCEKRKKNSQATQLVQLAESAELFHTPDGQAYASIPVDGHRETHALNAGGFRDWLKRQFYSQTRSVPGSQALQDAIGVMSGKAMYDGAERPVHLRVAEHDGEIWVDLANRDWQAVRITSQNWTVVDNPPVRFRRTRSMQALPRPISGGSLRELCRMLNLAEESQQILTFAWLSAALKPTGPYPILAVYGEQGSAKSTTSRMLRKLIDPNQVPLRSPPRSERDLVVAANNTWAVTFDNVSSIPGWLSDALCRLSTGGGFGTRELFSDTEEVLFDVTRPVIINGITDLATKSDLMDRAVCIRCPPIPVSKRLSETEIWGRFERAWPRILGALFDAVSLALRRRSKIQLDGMPRMADFALWGAAAEPAFGCDANAFLRAYGGNQADLNAAAIECSPLPVPLATLLEETNRWDGTATDLLQRLTQVVGEDVAKQRDWPKQPHILSNQLRRLAPNLRRTGIEVMFDNRTAHSRFIHITRAAVKNSVTSVISVTESAG